VIGREANQSFMDVSRGSTGLAIRSQVRRCPLGTRRKSAKAMDEPASGAVSSIQTGDTLSYARKFVIHLPRGAITGDLRESRSPRTYRGGKRNSRAIDLKSFFSFL